MDSVSLHCQISKQKHTWYTTGSEDSSAMADSTLAIAFATFANTTSTSTCSWAFSSSLEVSYGLIRKEQEFKSKTTSLSQPIFNICASVGSDLTCSSSTERWLCKKESQVPETRYRQEYSKFSQYPINMSQVLPSTLQALNCRHTTSS